MNVRTKSLLWAGAIMGTAAAGSAMDMPSGAVAAMIAGLSGGAAAMLNADRRRTGKCC